MSYRSADYQIDLSVDSAHSRVVALVGTGKDVLELGCATGYMSRVLAGRDCRVTGIEKNREAAEEARNACRRVIVQDLETMDFEEQLGEERFDVIVCADILEHLHAPGRVLADLTRYTRPEGYVVASIPNIGHVSVLIELLEGRFYYKPEGLLDATHIRFFTHGSVHRLFEDAGWVITRLERYLLEPEDTEFRTDLSRFAPAVVEALRSHPESTTYQFIVRGHLTGNEGPAEVLERRIHSEERTAGPRVGRGAAQGANGSSALEALLSRLRFLEEDQTWRSREMAALASRLQDADHNARLLRNEVDRRGVRIAELEAYLESIHGSRAWRLSRKAQLWGERIFPPGSRRGRFFLGR